MFRIMSFLKAMSNEQLDISFRKCRKSVGWKPQVRYISCNEVEVISKLSKEMISGTHKFFKTKIVKIFYPKRRDALSINFVDRITQRSLNDNIIYPTMVKSFILDNFACQTGKGPQYARKRITNKLRAFVRKHGRNGYFLKLDIHHYYPSMRHDLVLKMFSKYFFGRVFKLIKQIIETQYAGDVGLMPGSQLVQIAGIAFLNDIDHGIREKFHPFYSCRYMDDILVFDESKEKLEKILAYIKDELAKRSMEVNKRKTYIQSLKFPFVFLGFKFHITKSGKVEHYVTKQFAKHAFSKIKRIFICLYNKGDSLKGLDDYVQSIKAYTDEATQNKKFKRRLNYYVEKYKKIFKRTD